MLLDEILKGNIIFPKSPKKNSQKNKQFLVPEKRNIYIYYGLNS